MSARCSLRRAKRPVWRLRQAFPRQPLATEVVWRLADPSCSQGRLVGIWRSWIHASELRGLLMMASELDG